MALDKPFLCILALVTLGIGQIRPFDAVELEFIHQPSKTASKHLLESIGGGVALLGYDNDGRKDIVVAQGHVMENIQLTQPAVAYKEPMLLLRNEGKYYFTDASGSANEAFGAARCRPRRRVWRP